jgi:nucleotide-binding universal stress UspA family protein
MSIMKQIKRIVVGVDFSEGGDAALESAFALARSFDAVVDLVHAAEPGVFAAPTSLGSMALVDGAALFRQIDDGLTSRAQRATSDGIVCQTNCLTGFPAREIVRHAQKTGADLIVVGTHGRTGIEHVVLGSVAERIVQRSTCPVLVVPDRRKAAH